MDAKLQEILLDYGLEGYGLYWYCIELIANDVEPEKLNFELEHDCRVIARNTGSTVQRVQEMMTKFVDVGLFENSTGVITCLKLARVSDDYTAKLIRSNQATGCAVTGVRQTPINSDKNPLEESKTKEKKPDKKKVTKPDSFKQFFKMYPPNKKGGTDATAWKKAKTLGFTDNEFNLMIDDIEKRKALMPSWYSTYAIGITKYLEERIWLTPVTPEKQECNRFDQNIGTLQSMQFAPQQNKGLLND